MANTDFYVPFVGDDGQQYIRVKPHEKIVPANEWLDYVKHFCWYEYLTNANYGCTKNLDTNVATCSIDSAVLPYYIYLNIVDLFKTAIEPVWRMNGVDQFHISHGWSPGEKATGGKLSQHAKGQAVDITSSNPKTNKAIFDNFHAGAEEFKIDQLIWEMQRQAGGKGTCPPDGFPWLIHVSTAEKPRHNILWTETNGLDTAAYDWSLAKNKCSVEYWGGGGTVASGEGDVSDYTSPQVEGEKLVAGYAKTLEQIDAQLRNLEKDEVDVTWGKKMKGDASDWISLKQYILYLATRYCPQGVYPFIELINLTLLPQ